ncbi:aminopeptidase-like protein 6 [Elysia marginata]|uniref:Aminopeptidase-like protein 6 n=1 Tax=Elysia marginata TaxID=1093978 RepID=A0AAV4HCM8_9GAST|nr:aminopeptidase-like protein 6 [Elysia marginata]
MCTISNVDISCYLNEIILDNGPAKRTDICTISNVDISFYLIEIILDNGPAKQKKSAELVRAAGEKYGEPFEISRIRREVSRNLEIADIFSFIQTESRTLPT